MAKRTKDQRREKKKAKQKQNLRNHARKKKNFYAGLMGALNEAEQRALGAKVIPEQAVLPPAETEDEDLTKVPTEFMTGQD